MFRRDRRNGRHIRTIEVLGLRVGDGAGDEGYVYASFEEAVP
jgi:hypothetical protein